MRMSGYGPPRSRERPTEAPKADGDGRTPSRKKKSCPPCRWSREPPGILTSPAGRDSAPPPGRFPLVPVFPMSPPPYLIHHTADNRANGSLGILQNLASGASLIHQQNQISRPGTYMTIQRQHRLSHGFSEAGIDRAYQKHFGAFEPLMLACSPDVADHFSDKHQPSSSNWTPPMIPKTAASTGGRSSKA